MDIFNQELDKLTSSASLPMHMPGAKRNANIVDSCFLKDITEVYGMDNLQKPDGIIKDIETKASELYGYKDAFISVNGSTGLILSAIHSAYSNNPGKVLVALNCHISVWHAIELIGCRINTILPQNLNMAFMGPILPIDVERKLSMDKDITTFVMTSPTYEGIISDTKAIYDICKRHNVTLIIDEAHGAHLGLDEFFGDGAYGDLVIKSLHKTLHSPTQTGLMLSSGKINRTKIKRFVNIFQSTSPSYLLMSGISKCINDLYESKSILANWEEAVTLVENSLADLKNIKYFRGANVDRSKIILLCDGDKLSSILRTEYNILCEASYPTHLIAMTGIGDTIKSVTRFINAIKEIDLKYDLSLSVCESLLRRTDPKLPVSIKDALCFDTSSIPLPGSVGRKSAVYLYAYPPGIPVLLPGEEITSERIATISGYKGQLITPDGEVFAGQIKCFP